jgi:hypothetical protein
MLLNKEKTSVCDEMVAPRAQFTMNNPGITVEVSNTHSALETNVFFRRSVKAGARNFLLVCSG